jgi:hypothetical protein
VLLAAALLVVLPLLVGRRPAAASALSAVELARRVQASAGVPWSGLAVTSGALSVPGDASFAALADLLGGDNTLRVWWRATDDWRVDRVRGTGETDLFTHHGYTTRWVFESETATISPVSRIRLPDASDLLPPTLARSMLQGARDAELSRLPTTRVAGIDAPGLRLIPDDPAATLDHVDLWADPATGLALRVELFTSGARRPVVSTTLDQLDRTLPDASTTAFSPSADSRIAFDESVDVAAAANALTGIDLPPTLAGLSSRTGEEQGGVGVYGRGPTALIVLPLRGRVAGPLRQQLRAGAGATDTTAGTLTPVGPIGVLLTPDRFEGPALLLAGTVTAGTLERAAGQLLGTP